MLLEYGLWKVRSSNHKWIREMVLISPRIPQWGTMTDVFGEKMLRKVIFQSGTFKLKMLLETHIIASLFKNWSYDHMLVGWKTKKEMPIFKHITVYVYYKPLYLFPQTQRNSKTFCIMLPFLGLLQNSLSKSITFLLE